MVTIVSKELYVLNVMTSYAQDEKKQDLIMLMKLNHVVPCPGQTRKPDVWPQPGRGHSLGA